jgi:hypothetical protein
LGATDRPIFRTDLVSRPVEDAGHRFIEVTDPDSGDSFRFYEVEYAIACAMDGERDVVALADWAKIELGLDPTADELKTVIGTLADLGYLDNGVPRAAEPAPLDRPPPAGRTAVTPPGPPLGPSPFDFGAPVATPIGAEAARGVRDLSTDLSEHIPVRKADVQEAVRQSRSMHAPTLPPNEVDDDEFDEQQTPVPMTPSRAPAAAAAGADPFTAARRGAEAAAPTAPPSMSAALQKTLMGTGAPSAGQGPGGFGSRTPTPPPQVLPEKPEPGAFAGGAAAAQGHGRPPAAARPAAMSRDAKWSPSKGPSESPIVTPPRPAGFLPYLVVLLLLGALGAAAYWWFFVREAEGAGQGARTMSESPPVAPSAVAPTGVVPSAAAPSAAAPSAAAPNAAAPSAPAPQPEVAAPTPEPAELTATLEAGPAQEQEVHAPKAGRIAWLAPSGGEVSEGAPVAKFEGYQPIEYSVKEAQDSQRGYQEKLDQATAKGDKDAMKLAEGNVKRKQRDIDRHTEELAELVVKAPIGGVVEPSIKPHATVKQDEPVAKILAQSEPRATFTLPPGAAPAGAEVHIVSKSDPSLSATCKVDRSDPGKLVASCPTDSGLASGTTVVLKP